MYRKDGEIEQSPQYLAEPVTELDPRDNRSPDSWIPRHKSLIRITPHPLNAEPPTPLLLEKGFITPNSLHYVRNHGIVPKLSWNEHVLRIGGIVERPLLLSMEQLVNNFKPVKIPVTLTCNGNRRKEINMLRHTKGFNFGPGATSCAVWTGARLVDIIEACKPNLQRAKFVCFEGTEDLPKGKYGTSLPMAYVMDPTNDILVAYEMNGERLPPDHGFPVRMIIPGYVGGRSVKWLAKIEFTEGESDSHYHHEDNRLLPPVADFYNARQYFKQPETLLYQLNINSTIVYPKHDEVVQVSKDNLSQNLRIAGYAYGGGGRRINRIEVTLDEGNTWELGNVKYMDNATRHGCKVWVWAHWDIDVEMKKIANCSSIVVRAWDTAYNTQPKDRTWNLLGLMNNSWYRVKVDVKESSGLYQIRFAHPTVPGSFEQPTKGHIPQVENLKELTTPKSDVDNIFFSMEEIAKHNTAESCWIVIKGGVYDVTSYMKTHPGGPHTLVMHSGRDVTQLFFDIHASDAVRMKEHFRIGSVLDPAANLAKKSAEPSSSGDGWSKL